MEHEVDAMSVYGLFCRKILCINNGRYWIYHVWVLRVAAAFAHQSAGTGSVSYHARQQESHRSQDRLWTHNYCTLEPSLVFNSIVFYVRLPRYSPASLFDPQAKTYSIILLSYMDACSSGPRG